MVGTAVPLGPLLDEHVLVVVEERLEPVLHGELGVAPEEFVALLEETADARGRSEFLDACLAMDDFVAFKRGMLELKADLMGERLTN